MLAGQLSSGDGSFTIVFLHEVGLDLDSLHPLASQLGIDEALKLLVDLPGHGLSTGQLDPSHFDDDALALQRWVARNAATPLVIVSAGAATPFGCVLARTPDVIGLALLAPYGIEPSCDPPAPIPVPTIAVLPNRTKSVVETWHSLRGSVRNRWMSASMTAEVDDVVRFRGDLRSQIATHLQGFIREVYALHRLRRTPSRIAGPIQAKGDTDPTP